MAGHSKWAKVKHFKGALDAKRGRIFSKLSKEISIAARQGGADPTMNPRLRMVLLKCRAANMPSDNIERAIKRGVGGEEGSTLEELTYEVFGPNGVALLVELNTDNRNRTAAEIRSILTKNGGSMASSGAVTRLFQKKGQMIISRDAASEEQLMELALEAGAEDFRADADGYEILTDPASFEVVLRKLEEKQIKCEAAQIAPLPNLSVAVQDPAAVAAVTKLIEALEEHDDVKEVYSNADFQNIRLEHRTAKQRPPGPRSF